MTAQMLNWAKLVSQGRCKANGISWSDEESHAVALICEKTGRPMAEVAQYVRKGILTVEAFEKAQTTPGAVNPFLKLSKPDLLKKAQSLGLPASPDATVEVLAQAILEKKQKDAEEAKAKKKAEEEAKTAEIKEKTEAEMKAKEEARVKAKIEADKKAKEKATPKAKPKAPAKKKPASKPKAKPTKKK